jgi:hypothetical protein
VGLAANQQREFKSQKAIERSLAFRLQNRGVWSFSTIINVKQHATNPGEMPASASGF